jgi:DNA-binding MarR family transcriptional regulator
MVEIRITEKGLNLLAEIDDVHSEFKNDIVEGLTESEILTLNKLLEKIRNK